MNPTHKLKRVKKYSIRLEIYFKKSYSTRVEPIHRVSTQTTNIQNHSLLNNNNKLQK